MSELCSLRRFIIWMIHEVFSFPKKNVERAEKMVSKVNCVHINEIGGYTNYHENR